MVPTGGMGMPSGGMGMGMSMGGGAPGGDSFGVPNALVGYVIGKGGENIRDVQARTGTHVQIQREQDMMVGAQERLVTVSGPPAAVATAKQLILQMVEARKSEIARPGAPGGGGGSMGASGANAMGMGADASGGSNPVVTIHIPIPDAKVGLIIGKSGAMVQGIQRKTGVHIQVSCKTAVGTLEGCCIRYFCIALYIRFASLHAHSIDSTHILPSLSPTDPPGS